MNPSKPPLPGSHARPLATPIQIALIHKSRGSYHMRHHSTKVQYNPPNSSQIPSKGEMQFREPNPFKRRNLSLDEGNPQAARNPSYSDYLNLNDDD